MHKYELMVIIPNKLDAKAAEASFKDLQKSMTTEFGVKVTFDDFWGERGFAYKIKQDTWGYYGVLQFDMEAPKATELRHELNLNNEVLRFMLTRVDPRAKDARPYSEMQAEYEAQAKKKGEVKEEKPKGGKAAKLTTVKGDAPAQTKENAETTAAKVPAAKKDAVDKKLDAIIDESSTDL